MSWDDSVQSVISVWRSNRTVRLGARDRRLFLPSRKLERASEGFFWISLVQSVYIICGTGFQEFGFQHGFRLHHSVFMLMLIPMITKFTAINPAARRKLPSKSTLVCTYHVTLPTMSMSMSINTEWSMLEAKFLKSGSTNYMCRAHCYYYHLP